VPAVLPEVLVWVVGVVLAFGDARDHDAAASRDVPIQEEEHPPVTAQEADHR
jgi:hypothetical protein